MGKSEAARKFGQRGVYQGREVVLDLSYLESAFKKDPSLRDVASVDGDVLDLLQQED